MAGLYIHVPICRRKCLYCDFYSCGEGGVATSTLMNALTREIKLRKKEVSEPIDTLYIGGGTPSLLSASDINRLLNTAYDSFEISANAEITMEVNPDDISHSYAGDLKSIGINRISAGIQSLNDSELRAVGRRHDASGAIKAMEILRNTFDNCSFDLIFGLPGQTLSSWKHSVDGVLDFSPQHLSAYSLMYEPGTPLSALRDAGRIREIEEELSVEMFGTLIEQTDKSGMIQYEISNFSLPGYESRHNSSYWKGKPYLGIGPSAHSFDGRNTRRWNISDIKQYVKIETETTEAMYQEEYLTEVERIEEYIMTRLRMKSGIPLQEFAQLFGAQQSERLLSKASGMINNGELLLSENHLALSRETILTSDAVIVRLF